MNTRKAFLQAVFVLSWSPPPSTYKVTFTSDCPQAGRSSKGVQDYIP